MALSRLITLPPSHFSEKARWSLDHCGIPYVEERHATLLHRRPVRRAGGGRTVPVLVTDEGTFPDSNSILAWADQHARPGSRLFPDDQAARAEVEDWVARCDASMGPAAVQWIFAQVLELPAVAKRLTSEGVPGWERWLVPLMLPFGRHVLYRKRRLTPERLAQVRHKVVAAFDSVAERLRDGRTYLCGDGFTAADLTFAALSSLVLMPPRFGGARVEPSELPEGASDVAAWREHPAGRFTLMLYDKHR